MNKKAMIQECVQYILDQQHEREDLINNWIEDAKDYKRQGMKLPEIRKALYDMRENHIYYIAKCLAHGKRHANNAIRSVIAEVVEAVRRN